MKRKRFWSALGIVGLALALNPAAASASSLTGVAEYTYERCNQAWPAPNPQLATNLVSGAQAGAAGGHHFCWDALMYGVNSYSEGPLKAPGSVVATALGFPDSVDTELQTAWALTGKVLAQVENLTGIRGGVSVELNGTNPGVSYTVRGAGFNYRQRIVIRPLCLTCPSLNDASQSGGDSVSKFAWIDDARLTWTNEATDNRANGLAILNLYGANYKPHEAWDFYASAQAASVTPQNGHRVTKVLMEARPDNNNISVVEADPLSVNKYGSAGSFNLGATLSGEAKFGNYGGGGSFSVGRTWNFAEGTVGGGLLSEGTHYTQWQSGNKSGSTTAKSAQGVETWKVPTDSGIMIWYSGAAWIK